MKGKVDDLKKNTNTNYIVIEQLKTSGHLPDTLSSTPSGISHKRVIKSLLYSLQKNKQKIIYESIQACPLFVFVLCLSAFSHSCSLSLVYCLYGRAEYL